MRKSKGTERYVTKTDLSDLRTFEVVVLSDECLGATESEFRKVYARLEPGQALDPQRIYNTSP